MREHTFLYRKGYSLKQAKTEARERAECEYIHIGHGGRKGRGREKKERKSDLANRFKLPSTSHSWFQLRGFLYFLFGFRNAAVHYTPVASECHCITSKGGEEKRNEERGRRSPRLCTISDREVSSCLSYVPFFSIRSASDHFNHAF